MKKENIFYTDDMILYDELNHDFIIESLNDYEIEINDKNINIEIENQIQDRYYDLISCLDSFDALISYDSILVCVDFGLWYGRKKANKKFSSLRYAITNAAQDINTLYFKNKNSTLLLNACHHDGLNKYKFYIIRNNKKYAIKLNDLLSVY